MKIAPLYRALKKTDLAEPVIVHTSPHYDLNMSDAFFEAGARCGSSARRDLCGGCGETRIPTATQNLERFGATEKDDLI